MTTTRQRFIKTVSCFPLPAGTVGMTALRGKLWTDTVGGNPAQALFPAGHAPSGLRPANGAQYTDYATLFAAIPGAALEASFIVKIPGGGDGFCFGIPGGCEKSTLAQTATFAAVDRMTQAGHR